MPEKYNDAVIRLISESGFELANPDHLEFEKIGSGNISLIFRVKLKENASIVVKLTEKDDSQICSELHNREIDFYKWISEDREENKLKKTLKCPKLYGGFVQTRWFVGIFLMEDFSGRICNDSVNELKGFNIGIALNIVRELAAIQCVHLSSTSDLKNSLDRFDYSSGVRNCLPRMNSIEGITPEMRAKLNEWIEPVTLFKIHAEVPSDVEGISPTLIHCDLWVDNLLFTRNDDEVQLLSIIDWQCFKIGNPLLDIASILGVCMTTEDRREYTNVVLSLYVDEIEKRKESFKKPFDMTIQKAHRLLNHAYRWPCIQLMTALVTTSDEERLENPEEYEVFHPRLVEMLKDTIQENCERLDDR